MRVGYIRCHFGTQVYRDYTPDFWLNLVAKPSRKQKWHLFSMKVAYRKQTCEKILDTVVEASQQSQITEMRTCSHTAVVAEGTHHKSMIDLTALPIYIKMNPSKICVS